jgi:hypothetical protein
MSAYNPPRENVSIFDAQLFSTENSPTGNNNSAVSLNNNLSYIKLDLTPTTQPPNAGIANGSFPDTFTIPSAGTWEITGDFQVEYITGASPVSTAGFYVAINVVAGFYYTNFQTINANSAIDPIIEKFAITNLVSVSGATSFGVSYSFIGTPYGSILNGSLSAIKISTSTA